jgi:ribonuclease HI
MTPDPLRVIVHSDGGSRGNPGEAACGVVVYDENGDEMLVRGKRLGKATNNEAEYEGVLLALELCRELRASSVKLRIDSELVERQIKGIYKVKKKELKPLHARTLLLSRQFEGFVVEHIPREENARADGLVNAVLDGREVE